MWRVVGFLTLVVLAGCHQLFGLQAVEYDAPPAEAGLDAPVDALDVAGCSTLASLADDFNDGVMGLQWSSSADVAEVAGYLRFDVPAGTTRRAVSRWYHDMRDRSFAIAVWPETALTANDVISVALEDSARAGVRMRLRNGMLLLERLDGGAPIAVGQRTYDGPTHRFWRFSRAGTITTFETSSDGAIYTPLTTLELPALTFVRVVLEVTNTSSMPLIERFDDANNGIAQPDACSIGVLADELDGDTLDPKWDRTETYAGATTVGNGVVAMRSDVTNGQPGVNVWFRPRTVHDVTERAIAIDLSRVELPPPGGAQDGLVSLQLQPLTGGTATLEIIGGQLRGLWSLVPTAIVDPLPYDPEAHRWLRFRHTGTTLFWEASHDGGSFNVLGQFSGVSGFDQVDLLMRVLTPAGATAAIDLAAVRVF